MCDVCVFAETMSIRQRKLENEWVAEWFYFTEPKVVWQIVLEMDEYVEYAVFLGVQDPNIDGNLVVFRAHGPRTVTIPWPLAGLPIRQWQHLSFFGGQGRMTIWLEDTNHVMIKQETLRVVVKP